MDDQIERLQIYLPIKVDKCKKILSQMFQLQNLSVFKQAKNLELNKCLGIPPGNS